MKINVVKNWTGLSGELVEVIVRKPTVTGRRDRKGRPQPQNKVVSYKGERHVAFLLTGEHYAERGIAGWCIEV